MNHTSKRFLLISTLVLAACSDADYPDGASGGSAELALSQVPSDVNCLVVSVTGPRSIVRSFPVTPGTPADLLLTGLGIGQNGFSAEAFDTACAMLAAAPQTVPTWASLPVEAQIQPGVLAEVALVLKRNGRATVAVSFEELPDAGANLDASSPTPPDAGGSCHPLINEVQTAGPGGAADEFVELYNPCGEYALADHRLVYRSAAGTSDVLLQNLAPFTIPAAGYLVFGGSTFTGSFSAGTLAAGLAAAGGGVALVRAGEVLDSIGYGSATNAFVEGVAAPAPPSGNSIARMPTGTDTNSNNTDFAVVVAPTPGAAN